MGDDGDYLEGFECSMFVDESDKPSIVDYPFEGGITAKITEIPRHNQHVAASEQQVLWGSALVLSRFLTKNREKLKGRRILELGGGCGLVGLVCALAMNSCHSQEQNNGEFKDKKEVVMLTDGQKETVDRFEPTLLQNDFIKLSNGFFEAGKREGRKEGKEEKEKEKETTDGGVCLGTDHLWWGKKEAEIHGEKYGKYNLIVGSSVTYFQEGIAPLLHTIAHLLEGNKGEKEGKEGKKERKEGEKEGKEGEKEGKEGEKEGEEGEKEGGMWEGGLVLLAFNTVRMSNYYDYFAKIAEELHLEIHQVDVSDCLKKTVEGEKVEEGWLHSEKLIFLKKK